MAALTYEMLLVAFAAFLTFPIVLLFFGTAMPSLYRGGDRGEQGRRHGTGRGLAPIIKVILHYSKFNQNYTCFSLLKIYLFCFF